MMPVRRDYPLLVMFFIRNHVNHLWGILAFLDIVVFINTKKSRFFQMYCSN